jgi:hypothetical protein
MATSTWTFTYDGNGNTATTYPDLFQTTSTTLAYQDTASHVNSPTPPLESGGKPPLSGTAVC